MTGPGLVHHEDAPDAVDPADQLSQNPLLPDAHGVEPFAVGLQVLVHHGKELLHRRGLLRVGELASNGICQGAFPGKEGISGAVTAHVNPQQQQYRAAAPADRQGHVIRGLPIGPVLLEAHITNGEQPGGKDQPQKAPQHPADPPPGPAEAIAFLHAVGIVLPLDRHQNQNDGNGKQAEHRQQRDVNRRIPRPAEEASLLLLHDLFLPPRAPWNRGHFLIFYSSS